MFNITPNGANRIDIEVNGKLDSDEMGIALDDFVAKSSGIENGRMLYRIQDFEFPTLGAIGVEFSRMPGLLRVMRNYERAAVLADENWIRRVSEWEGALFPGLEIKAFRPGEEAAAEAWLNS